MQSRAKVLTGLLAGLLACSALGSAACDSLGTPAATKGKVPDATVVATYHPRGPSFKLELTYAEKILVPRGSDLNVKIHDATGKTVFTHKTTTGQDAPPYVVSVAINSPVAYPLKVDAKLVSRIGHRFGESTEISESGAQGAKPVEIWMKPQQ
jgi:hypothetical protein